MLNDVLVKGGAWLRAVRKERGYTQERLAAEDRSYAPAAAPERFPHKREF